MALVSQQHKEEPLQGRARLRPPADSEGSVPIISLPAIAGPQGHQLLDTGPLYSLIPILTHCPKTGGLSPRILHLQMLHSPRSPRKGTWVSIWLQNRALSADAWISAQNKPASKPQQGLGSTASFCQVVAEVRMG